MADPLELAQVAKEHGQVYVEIQLDVGAHLGRASLGSASGQRTTGSSAQALGAIERIGWRLVHAGYFFMPLGETSTSKFFGTGENTAVTGTTVGVYLFRNVDAP